MSIEQELRDLVKAVRLGKPGDVEIACSAAERWIREAKSDRATYAAQIEEARSVCNGELEIDDEPFLSVAAPSGVWVSAWVWVELASDEGDEE